MTSPNTMLAVLAALIFIAVLATHVLRATTRVAWWLPALASALFLGLSTYAVATEGFWGFWTEHVSSAWGNQIWFDLLFAASIGWVALLPRVRAAGMRPWVWAIALVATGSVALLAMLARVLYLEGHASASAQARETRGAREVREHQTSAHRFEAEGAS